MICIVYLRESSLSIKTLPGIVVHLFIGIGSIYYTFRSKRLQVDKGRWWVGVSDLILQDDVFPVGTAAYVERVKFYLM